MKFFIVTPSFNQIDWLRLCISSVADQATASPPCSNTTNLSSKISPLVVHHHVQDGASTDGTKAFLYEYASRIKKNRENIGQGDYHFSFESSPDFGMYDAINKGWKYAGSDVDIFAYLNCDEQYLQGTLEFVQNYLIKRPEVDILFGDTLLIRPNGSLLAYRKGYQPRWYYILASHLYILSCTMFFREKIIADGYNFDMQLKYIGDADFVIRLIKAGYHAARARRYLSAFTMTGENMSASQNARFEYEQVLSATPRSFRALRFPINICRLGEKFLSGAYFQKMPIRYAVFTYNNVSNRTEFLFRKATSRWPTSITNI
jgi:glycosyltransferase involved in cell wall biosynthesis